MNVGTSSSPTEEENDIIDPHHVSASCLLRFLISAAKVVLFSGMTKLLHKKNPTLHNSTPTLPNFILSSYQKTTRRWSTTKKKRRTIAYFKKNM
jgi:hypothetical protein